MHLSRSPSHGRLRPPRKRFFSFAPAGFTSFPAIGPSLPSGGGLASLSRQRSSKKGTFSGKCAFQRGGAWGGKSSGFSPQRFPPPMTKEIRETFPQEDRRCPNTDVQKWISRTSYIALFFFFFCCLQLFFFFFP